LVFPPVLKTEAMTDIDAILRQFVELHASDLHLKIGRPPVFRLSDGLRPDLDSPALTADSLESVFLHVTSEAQRIQFAAARSLDFAYSLPGLARFRVSAIKQRGSLSLAIRHVPHEIPPMEGLGLPQVCQQLILRPRGLILVTGPAGSGKSTTLAAMIEYLNQHESRSVITVEDPIEFLFQDKRCLIHQRDLGDDCPSFAQGLTDALRHDPDVIVIGEMRDLDTISTAMTAAETGHLVLGTLHTIDAAQSVDRIVDMFPFGQQRQIRLQLSQVIEGVLSQALLPQIGGGRVAAFEVMLGTSVIRRLIRDEKVYEIGANIEMGRLEGMQTLDQALADLVKAERITSDDAMAKSNNPRRLAEFVRGASTGSYGFGAAPSRSR
jgi:twitching motility protein PilT